MHNQTSKPDLVEIAVKQVTSNLTNTSGPIQTPVARCGSSSHHPPRAFAARELGNTLKRLLEATSSCRNLKKFHTFPLVFHQLRWNTFASPLPPNQCCMDFDMPIKVTRNNIERGRGVGRANKALISFQRAALTRKSDFPGECLNNFANACLIALPLYCVGGR